MTLSPNERELAWDVRSGSALKDSAGGVYIFSRSALQWVQVDSLDRVYALDTDRRAVIAFDTSGFEKRQIGRQGRGPGELTLPSTMLLTGDTVIVFDESRRSIVRWANYGESLLPELRPLGRASRAAPISVAGDSFLSLTERDSNGTRLWTLEWLPNGRRIAEIEDTVPRAVLTSDCARSALPRLMRPFGAPDIHVAARRDLVALTQPIPTFEIRVFKNGYLSTIVRRPRDSRLARQVELPPRRQIAYRIRSPTADCAITYGELVDDLGVYSSTAAIAELAVMDDGSIWVRRTGRLEQEQWVEGIDRAGSYLGSLRSEFLPVGVLKDGRFIVPMRDPATGGIMLLRVRYASRINN